MKKIGVVILTAALIAVMIFCGHGIWDEMSEYKEADDINKGIAEEARADKFDGNIDFEALWKINPDVAGWLYSEDTSINYPVVKCDSNSKYLRRDLHGNYSISGTLFIDADNSDNLQDFNTIIYGHHMKDPKQTMFGSFRNYIGNQKYYEKHKQLEYITPEKKYHLQVIAVCTTPAGGWAYDKDFDTKEEREKFISDAVSSSEVQPAFTATGSDKLMTLSTCAYEYEGARYVVIGKLVPWE